MTRRLTIHQLCSILGESHYPSDVRSWVERGMPARRDVHGLWFEEEEARAWVRENVSRGLLNSPYAPPSFLVGAVRPKPSEPSAQDEAMPETKQLLTVQEIADRFGVSSPAVHQWIASGCPVAHKGRPKKLDLQEVHEWRDSRAKRPATKEESDAPAVQEPEAVSDTVEIGATEAEEESAEWEKREEEYERVEPAIQAESRPGVISARTPQEHATLIRDRLQALHAALDAGAGSGLEIDLSVHEVRRIGIRIRAVLEL